MESSRASPNTKNYSLPRGKVSFAVLGEDEYARGEIDLGNCSSLDLTNASTWKEHESSQSGVVILDAKKQIAQKYNIKMNLEEQSLENLAMFFLGDATLPRGDNANVETQVQGSRSGESVTIRTARWVQLYLASGEPVRYIKPGTLYLAGGQIIPSAFYAVDYENGMFMIKDTSVFNDGDVVTAAYSYGGFTIPKIVPRIGKPLIGMLRYRGLSESGPRHSCECWKVQIAPDSPLGLIKPGDIAAISFSGEVFKDDDSQSHSDYPFFQIVELGTATVTYPES